MRTTKKTIVRREHWRWQRCGIGRSELRRVHVRESNVTLGPSDTRQLDLLDSSLGRGARRTARRHASDHGNASAEPRQVLRSYWRRQPFGPRSLLRKTILVDVHG